MSTAVEQPPVPRLLLASLRNTGYTLECAVADIVDNSITAGASRVSIQSRFRTDMEKPWIAVCDNGQGMDKDMLFTCMKFGSRDLAAERRGKCDLGRFGLGMKTASLSQCCKMTVFSWQGGVCSAYCWDLAQISEKWEMQELDAVEISAHPILQCVLETMLFPVQEHGTVVLWERLDRDYAKSPNSFNAAMNQVECHLSQVFHRFMEKEYDYPDVVRFDRNNREMQPASPFGHDEHIRSRLPGERIKCGDYYVDYRPYLLPPAICYTNSEAYRALGGAEGYMQNQGFYVYRNRRLIEKATWFRVRRKEFKTQLLRIRLDIPAELDFLWNVDVRKSQTSPPAEVLEVLERIVDSALEKARRFWDGGLSVRKPAFCSKESAWLTPGTRKASSYRINKNHELYKLLLNALPQPGLRKVFSEYMDMLSELFPYERYYSDRNQSEGTWQEPERDCGNRLAELINNLSEAGLSEERVRRVLCCYESSFPDELVEKYLNIRYGRHE